MATIAEVFNRAVADHRAGRFDLAESACREILRIDPGHVDALRLLGTAAQQRGQPHLAVDCLRRIAELSPSNLLAQRELIDAYRASGDLDRAADCVERLLTDRPSDALLWLQLAELRKSQDRLGEAAACFRRAAANLPDDPVRELWLATLCPSVFESVGEIRNYRQLLRTTLNRVKDRRWQLDPREILSRATTPPYELQYHGLDDRPLKEAYANLFRDRFAREAAGCGHGKPRIGIVVTAQHERVFLGCMRGLVERLDQKEFALDLICTESGARILGGSPGLAGVERLVIGDDFPQTVNRIRDARYDVLLYWETGSDVINYFLPFFRLAPVQCTTWGVPETSGIPWMDYYLSSRHVEIDDAASHYTEQLVRAKTLLVWRERPRLDGRPKQRARFGLHDDQHVYLCVQQIRKYHPEFDSILRAILERDKRAVVVIVEDRHPSRVRRLKIRLAAFLGKLAERIIFVPQQTPSDYLHLTAACNVLLDTPYFGGGITTYDGLGLGKAIVTLPGPFRRSRFATACYQKMGIDSCVATSPAHYVDLAVGLGCNAVYRRHVEQQIRETSDVLFEERAAADDFQELMQFLIAEARRRG